MNDDQKTCDPQRIKLSLGQKLSDEEQTAFELHLEDCDDCRRRLEATAAGDDMWSDARDSLLGQQADCPQSRAPALDSGIDPAPGIKYQTGFDIPSGGEGQPGVLGNLNQIVTFQGGQRCW